MLQNLIDFFAAHSQSVIALLLAVSEILGFSAKGGILSMIYDLLKKASEKKDEPKA